MWVAFQIHFYILFFILCYFSQNYLNSNERKNCFLNEEQVKVNLPNHLQLSTLPIDIKVSFFSINDRHKN